MSTTTPAPDLAAIKARQQKTWSAGYAAIGSRIPMISEQLADAADLRAGWRVLDIAGGNGNTALAAARCDCDVVSIDYVPGLLEQARARAAADGLPIEFIEADAEALPFADGEFDAVISVMGVMFAPDHDRTAAEAARVTRPGGTIALANWTPDGFIGQLFKAVGAFIPPPAGLRSPALWGTEEHVRTVFGDAIGSVRAVRRSYTFRYSSAQRLVDVFRTEYGPTLKVFEALESPRREEFEATFLELVDRFDRLDGEDAVAVPSDYLEVVATRA
jgi:ubiquinone/menaquinone biosynthesis C-methylase UbiE